MKAILSGLAIFLLVYAPQAAAGQRPKLCGDMMRIQKALEDARVMAAELRGMASAQKDYITRRELTKKAKDLTRLVQVLRSELSLPQEPAPTPVEETQEPEIVLQPMTPVDFQHLLSAIEAESFTKGRLRVLQSAVPHNYFTVDQIKKVMKKFSFASGKTQAAAMMYARLLDKNNFYRVYEELSFDSDKKKLKEMISK